MVISKYQVCDWFTKFKEGKMIGDNLHPDHPRKSKTDINIQKDSKIVCKNCHLK